MKRKKDYLIKIVFFLLCVTFTTAEDEEVILEKLWHQVSTFQLEQSMTPTMEFAHLVAPIDFTTVEDTRDELQKFLDTSLKRLHVFLRVL